MTAAACAGAIVAAFAFAPSTGGRLSAAEARNWSPVYRLRRVPRPARGTTTRARRSSSARTPNTTSSRSSRTETPVRSASAAPSRARWTSPGRSPRSTATPISSRWRCSIARAPSRCSSSASAAAPRRNACGGTSRGSRSTWSSSIRSWSTSPAATSRFPTTRGCEIENEDGRLFLAKTNRKWDAIAIDVFYEDGIPFHMSTFEFLELVRERLEPGGVVLMNVIGSIRGSGSELFRALYRTYRAVFPTVVVHPDVAPDGGIQNLMVVATEQPRQRNRCSSIAGATLGSGRATYPDLRERIGDRVGSGIEIDRRSDADGRLRADGRAARRMTSSTRRTA